MDDVRNVAIIAHVDHGKTTLIDAMLKQTHTFRNNQKEMSETLLMDSNILEREKGITILSKNTSIFYKKTKINIIDTPGHADFGGEVERILNMASGAILLVDAAEGPLPQTKFVMKKAMLHKLKIILIINKIDKKDARPKEVINEVENLFLDLVDQDKYLDFSTLYAVGRDGKAFFTLPQEYNQNINGDLSPLFETILNDIPNSSLYEDKPFQMLISALDYNNYTGILGIGKINQGKLKKGDSISLVEDNRILGIYKSQKIYTSVGLDRKEVAETVCGDIIAVAGIPKLTIGQTITNPLYPISLPKISVEEPTIKITIGPNTSPFSGREGKLCLSAQIKARLAKEKETNLGLKIESDPNSSNYIISGRGELHLAILIETMRREGFELSISKPEVIYKTVNNVIFEPFEEVTIDVSTTYVGVISEELAKRKGELLNMTLVNDTITRFVYRISSRNLLGIRNNLMIKTRGTVIFSSYFLGYNPKGADVGIIRNGVLIAFESGTSLSYGLANAQERGALFIGPGISVYSGMIIGISNRKKDIEINVCKGKKMTNVRSETADIAIQLTPPLQLSLEQALDFINDDELLEVTPLNIRIRKKYLSAVKRKIMERNRLSALQI